MYNPIKQLSKQDWLLWLVSVIFLTVSNTVIGKFDALVLFATLIGVTSLIFAAMGNAWGQILMIVFSLCYSAISWGFRYWGELITYAGMALPMAVWSTITWIKNPAKNGRTVAIQKITVKHIVMLSFFSAVVTGTIGYALYLLKTPNLAFSILSITTSFVAAALTMLRSAYFALFYALNDVVLIILWSIASFENPIYISIVVNFAIFFINDMYGFYSWKKREQNQAD